ncbi:MAG: DUF5668 domain-containing protein [Bacteroidales bacterium]|jgi:predicted membrane protein|nr:DUF5668 domain-containing protein [Bacteroidales bacterium]
MRDHQRKHESNSRLIAGIIILTAGLLFLFNNLNILPSNVEYYIFSWKTLLIAIGTLNLLFSHNRTAGFILITVGLVFWIPDIINIPINTSRFIWPMAIIAVGLFIMFKRPDGGFGHRFWEDKFKNRNGENETEEGQSNFMAEDYIDNVAIFGGGERVVTSKNFKGGKLTAIFGGSEIRLHHAKLAPGNQVLDVFFMFGGSGIVVPVDWTVNVDVVSIFGGFSDKRFVRKPEENTEESQSVLTIKGFVLFGGGEIKTY